MNLPWSLKESSPSEVELLVEALELSPISASVLVRRGYSDPARAREFLEQHDVGHDVAGLGDVDAALGILRAAIDRGSRICVHGDYDVDGICATALAYSVLRDLGANVRWFLPSRFVEGYGLQRETVDALVEDGVDVLLSVDCGIAAVDEVAYARERGLEVIVTDHHRPGERLPECPIIATRPSSYPFPELCGTGVAYKLMQALAPSTELDSMLDLVAMATVADVVPLLDENRALTAAGLKRLACTSRPGLQALMRSAQVDPAIVDAGAIGFRLAPRINAAGRLGHPDVALKLLLSTTREEANELASQCERLNRERQAIEERITGEALRQIEQWSAERRERRAYVLWEEDWHVGVIGIVASRLVERFHRPVVLLSASEDGWRGSGRSIAAFDLFAGLSACGHLLEAFGGHRAAAGLAIARDNLDQLGVELAAIAARELVEDDLAPMTKIDAVVHGDELTLELCDELQRLAPFGLGNPGVTLLVPACELVDVTPVGQGKHLRLGVVASVGADRVRSGAIAFGLGAQAEKLSQPGRWDLVFRLEANHWNGSVSPQLVVRQIFESTAAYAGLRDRFAREWRSGSENWSPEGRAIFRELQLVDGAELSFRRHLVEADTFQRLLAQACAAPPAELAQAA